MSERADALDLADAPPRRPRSPVRTIAIAVGLVMVAFAVVLALRLGEPSSYTGTALLGDPVPDLALPTLDGDTLVLREMAGKAVIVNFWNSWCIPCREEEPALVSFYAAHRGDPDFEMVGIVRDDSRSAIEEWVASHGTPWTITLDPGARAAIDFATTGQPETYAISPDGVVVGRHLGRATARDLEELLALARGEGDDDRGERE